MDNKKLYYGLGIAAIVGIIFYLSKKNKESVANESKSRAIGGESKEAVKKESSESSPSTSGINENILTKAANNLSVKSKERGINISGNDIKKKILSFSKNYTPVEKEVLSAFLSLYSNDKFTSKDSDAMMAESYFKTIEPITKKYSQSQIDGAVMKFNMDMASVMK